MGDGPQLERWPLLADGSGVHAVGLCRKSLNASSVHSASPCQRFLSYARFDLLVIGHRCTSTLARQKETSDSLFRAVIPLDLL